MDAKRIRISKNKARNFPHQFLIRLKPPLQNGVLGDR